MTAKIVRFQVSGTAQDRTKLPATFWTRLKTMGLTPAAVLRHSNVPPTVYGGEGLVTTAQLFALWRSIHALGKDPTLGWKGIAKTDSDQFHPALLAALNARTYRECLERFARYKQLCGTQEFQFTQNGDEFSIEMFFPFGGDEPIPTLFLDAVFALMVELGRRGTETRLTPKRIELRRPEEPGSGLSGYFGCPIKYRARRDALVLRSADLDLPFVAHNEELLSMLAPQLERQLQSGKGKPRIGDQVKWVLRRLLSGSSPDVVMVAKELGMSARTLQRRITEESTTFRDLLNETRRELVRQYLADKSIEIPEIAFLVGYDSANSFYRAFRTWEGKTPAEWRAVQRQSKAS
ncbi:MAG TPA: AraC family transcriptional regulator ligand-binding domain-containing protein [Lacipirellulaceae bacterium]|nr:AraC family transcriptional regulator ligand-binding domain-containing protein [Lacipirellulaceae bacterium]